MSLGIAGSSVAANKFSEKSIDVFFDKHEQAVVDTLIDFKSKESIQQLIVGRNTMDESKKMKLYKNGRMTVRNFITSAGPLPRAFNSLRQKGTPAKLFTFAPAIVTSLIYFGILPKPDGITHEQIQKDVLSDGRTVDMMLYVLEGLCIVFPELLPALPTLRKIHPIANVVMHSQVKISQAVYNASVKDGIVVGTRPVLLDALNEHDSFDEEDPFAIAA